VDEDGNIVVLRGVSFTGYEWGSWRSHTEDDYVRIASWGFNVVRLPIAWSYIEPQPGVYDISYFENYIDKDVAWAKKYGIYIILDMHQWVWSPYFSWWGGHGNGFPVWGVSEYPNTSEGVGRAITDFWLGKGPNGTEPSDTNPSMQERFINVWRIVANRYKNEPHVMFELFNEPYRSDYYYPEGGLTSYETAEYLYPFYETLIKAIREIAPYNIIIYQPVSGWHVSSARKMMYPNVVFSFHCYDFADSYDGNASALEYNFYKKFMSKPDLDPIMNWSIPILLGEFGTGLENPNASLWIKDMTTICAKYQLHWIWWNYFRSDVGSSLLYGNGTEKTTLTEPLKEATRT
jgi:endoglycosylceramidase